MNPQALQALEAMMDAQAQKSLAAMTPTSWREPFYKAAERLEKAEQAGLPPPNIDMAVFGRCVWCRRDLYPPRKPMQCSACKAVIYCSKACSTNSWSKLSDWNNPTHKKLCSDNKRHMKRLPEAQAAVQSFPWGRLESDGTFCLSLAKARFKVLGAAGNGFWSARDGSASHQIDDESLKNDSILAREIAAGMVHLDGYDLLHSKNHLSDEQGWKLKPELIPYRDMTKIPADRRPLLVTQFEGGVTDWDSWYSWRKLTKSSPAALLMSFPLSVYQLLVSVLKMTTPSAGNISKRVELCVHMLGPELELNFLPAFAELALLLPYHDITLIMAGPSVAKLMQAASSQGMHDSPLRRSISSKTPIFTYKAPEDLGSGALTIMLLKSPIWGTELLQGLDEIDIGLRPDAVVGLDAGLGAYRTWMDVMRITHQYNVPFAVTEYTEQSLEFAINENLKIAIRTPPARHYDIAFNPFHRPGQRSQPTHKMPNLVNGFTMVVVGHK